MKRMMIKSSVAVAALLVASGAFAAGPPAGVPAGPPAGIPMGPPPGVGGGPPAGIPAGGPPAGVPMGPPAGVPAGPPSGVTHGPPSSVTSNTTHGKPANLAGSPSTNAASDSASSVGKAASLLKQLNAGHASANGMQHASSKSIVGAIYAYKTSTVSAQTAIDKYTPLVKQWTTTVNADKAAVTKAQNYLDSLSTTDPNYAQAKTDLQTAQDQLAADQKTLDGYQSQLTQAQNDLQAAQDTLQTSTNVQLSPDVVKQLNTLLGISTT